MYGYLYKNYFFIATMTSIVVLVMLFVGGFPFGRSLFINSFFWGGLTSSYLVIAYFRYRNIWLLFLNLKIPVFWHLTMAVIAFLVVTIALIFIGGRALGF